MTKPGALTRGTQPGTLTSRELEVLRLVASGCRRGDIGQKLGLAPSTVKNHIYRITRKLGVTSREDAVTVAILNGLIVPAEVEASTEVGLEALSPRQQEVLELMVHSSAAEIAELLGVEVATVKRDKSSAYRILGVASHGAALTRYHRIRDAHRESTSNKAGDLEESARSVVRALCNGKSLQTAALINGLEDREVEMVTRRIIRLANVEDLTMAVVHILRDELMPGISLPRFRAPDFGLLDSKQQELLNEVCESRQLSIVAYADIHSVDAKTVMVGLWEIASRLSLNTPIHVIATAFAKRSVEPA